MCANQWFELLTTIEGAWKIEDRNRRTSQDQQGQQIIDK